MSQPPEVPQQSGNEEGPPDKPRGIGAVVLHHTVTVLMLVMILAIGVWTFLTFRDSNFFKSPDQTELTRTSVYSARAQVRRIESALRVYHRLENAYPADLQALVDRKLLLPSDLHYPSGSVEYEYRRAGNSFELELVH